MSSAANSSSPTGVGATLPSPHDGSSSSLSNNLLCSSAVNNIGTPPLKPSPTARLSSFPDSRLNPIPPGTPGSTSSAMSLETPRSRKSRKTLSEASVVMAKARARSAQRMNDSMVYLDGPQIYTCGQCRTHLTSHDDIISKSFHGRHGRAYLFDQCVNVTIGTAEDRVLITGLHSVCDIFCKRCKGMVGWTYARAYESSQKYKEGKYIIEKINLHMEESDYYAVSHPAGERPDRWRLRSMSWGSESISPSQGSDIVYEYHPHNNSSSSVGRPYMYSPRNNAPASCPTIRPRFAGLDSPPSPHLPAAPDL